MKHKRIFQLASGFIALGFVGMLWIAQVSSKSMAEVGQYPVFLPVVNRPLCNFPAKETVDFFEHEPNNTFREAIGPVRPFETAWGCFHAADDINDAYYFDLTVPSPIEVKLTNIPAGRNYDLVLYDKNRVRIAYSDRPGNEDEVIRSEKEMPGGRYYVQVHNASKKASAQTYKLEFDYDLYYGCDHPAIISELFPQVKDEHNTYPIISLNPNFECTLITDPAYVHSGYLALKLDYKAGEREGYWGVATQNGFDASSFTDFCLWVYAEETLQTFTINIKDTTGNEKPSTPQTIVETNRWQQICVPLKQYEDLRVQIDKIENVNVHFNKVLGDATIWVDDFEFKSVPQCDHPFVTTEIFPQLKDEPGQFPFYSKNMVFHCRVVEDTVHTKPVALEMKYDDGEDIGFWGIATPRGYDAGKFSSICFWAYAEESYQTFAIHIKDTAGTEMPSTPITIVDKYDWKRYCIPLSQYAVQGVQLDKVENVNVHFSKELSDAAVWFDDFRYEN